MSYAAIRTESPIEEDFIGALKTVSQGRVIFMPRATVSDLMKRAGGDDQRQHVFASSQVKHQKWRADFMLAANYAVGQSRLLCVECDGHEWHRKNSGQMLRDSARDNEFLRSGVETLRFSGGRLKNDPFSCAHEALEKLGFQRRQIVTLAAGLAGALNMAEWNYARRTQS